MRDTACSVDDCPDAEYVRSWCHRHYRRWLHHGDPLGGDPSRPALSNGQLRERLKRGIEQVRDPVGLAKSYLARRHLLGGPDEDDLTDVAIQAIVDAALAWDPHGGRSIASWAYMYMDRDVTRELGRCVDRRSQLGRRHDLADSERDRLAPDQGTAPVRHDTHDQWLRCDPNLDPFTTVELRADLQRWADLAELTPLMRFLVEYAAYHYGTYVRGTPYAGIPTPLAGSGATTLKHALKHMRRAAVTNERRDDKWTRMRDRRFLEERSSRLLAELRANETARERQAAV